MRHICKMEKLEIRAVIKYFCKEGMPPKENEGFMETLGKESLSYSTVKKNGQQSLRGGVLRMKDGLATADENVEGRAHPGYV